jgi:hypothetical protein
MSKLLEGSELDRNNNFKGNIRDIVIKSLDSNMFGQDNF